MDWKLDGYTLVGLSLNVDEGSTAIGKYVDSRDITDEMLDDHIDDGDDEASLIHVDAPSDLSPFPDSEVLKFISETNANNFIRLRFNGLSDIIAKFEIINVYDKTETYFEDFDSYNILRYSNNTDQLYRSEEFTIGLESPQEARLNAWAEKHTYLGQDPRFRILGIPVGYGDLEESMINFAKTTETNLFGKVPTIS